MFAFAKKFDVSFLWGVVVVLSLAGMSVSTEVFARGGGGGGEASDTAAKKETGGTAPKPVKKKAFVPDTEGLWSTQRSVRKVNTKLHKYATDDSLQGLATSFERLSKFRRNLDRLFSAAKTTKQQTDVNNIYTQLQRYGSQKKNKTLRSNARSILASLAAISELNRAKKKKKEFDKARKTKDPVDDIDARIEYEDACEEYKRALRKVPKNRRGMFPNPCL